MLPTRSRQARSTNTSRPSSAPSSSRHAAWRKCWKSVSREVSRHIVLAAQMPENKVTAAFLHEAHQGFGAVRIAQMSLP